MTRVRGLLQGADCRHAPRADRPGLSLLCSRSLRRTRPGAGPSGGIEGRGRPGCDRAPRFTARTQGTTMHAFWGLPPGSRFASFLLAPRSCAWRPMEWQRSAAYGRCGSSSMVGSAGWTAGALAGPRRLQRLAARRHYLRAAAPSAQVKSCLVARRPTLPRSVTVVEPAPTRDHSERMLASMGAQLERKGQPNHHRPAAAVPGAGARCPGRFLRPRSCRSAALYRRQRDHGCAASA